MSVQSLYPWVVDEYSGRQRGNYIDGECPLCGKRKLSFWIGDDGTSLAFKCWVGCDKSEILRCRGREFKNCFVGTPPEKPVQEVTATYRYTDENGILLYEKRRLEPGFGGRSKTFQFRRPLPDGRWACGLKAGTYGSTKEGGRFLKYGLPGMELPECRRVLYNLPLVLDDKRRVVHIVGGEKDCDTLTQLDFVATTADRGETSGWDDANSRLLDGRSVVVIEDGDDAGCRYAHQVVGSLLWAGSVPVRRVKLPQKDATRFISELRASGVRDKQQLRAALSAEFLRGSSWRKT